MSEFKVFYSWQSDLPNATNRGFIGEALKKACKKIASDPTIEDAPRVDQDTKDLSGAPLIPQAIMEKIDSCQAFVADVSLCYQGPGEKVAPNPNVIYELGYAVARLSWERIILVVNDQFGKVESLPFDLEKRRALVYHAEEGEENRSAAKKGLVEALAKGVEAITRYQPIVPRVTPAMAAREAIINQAPNRTFVIREFSKWLLDSLEELKPNSNDPEEFVKVLDSTLPLVRSFSSVSEAISAFPDDYYTLQELWRVFEKFLDRYDLPVRFEGGYNPVSFDWWKFHGSECCIVLVGHLLKEWRLKGLSMILREQFVQKRWLANGVGSSWDFRHLHDHLGILDRWNQGLCAKGQRGWISPCGQLFMIRHQMNSDPYLDWESFCEADSFLALSSLASPTEFSLDNWINETHIYSRFIPAFLAKARREEKAIELAVAFHQDDLEHLKSFLLNGWKSNNDIWRMTYRGDKTPAEAISSIGSLP